MRPRIAEDLELLCEEYGEVQHGEVAGEDWFLLPRYSITPGWQLGAEPVDDVPVAFFVKAGYPGTPPYGFFGPSGLNFEGRKPGSPGSPATMPPFKGDWMHFSWSVEDWRPTAELRKGSNLLAWARSFWQRFKEEA